MADAAPSHEPRSITVTRGDGGFGFNLSCIEKQHVLRVVDAGGPAHAAGARQGDVIVSVGTDSALGKTHADVVKLIKAAGNPLSLVVQTWAGVTTSATKKGNVTSPTKTAGGQGSKKTLIITKGAKGLGFNVSKINGKHILRKVEQGGAAAAAGANVGDEVVEVGGKSMVGVSHKELVDAIRGAGSKVNMTVVPAMETRTVKAVQQDQIDSRLRDFMQSKQKQRMPAAAGAAERVQKLIKHAQLATARAQMERDNAERRLKEIQEQEARKLQLQSDIDAMDQKLESLLANWEDKEMELEEQKIKTRQFATGKEVVELENLMAKVEQDAKSDLQAKQQEEAQGVPSNDPMVMRLMQKQREVDLATLAEELLALRIQELQKLSVTAKDRRAKEAEAAAQEHERIKQLREKDMRFLQDKQKRIDERLARAEEVKAKEDAERKAAQEKLQAERDAKRSELAEQNRRMKELRAQEEKKKAREEEKRKAKEEEDKVWREKEEQRLAEIAAKKREELEEQERQRSAALKFGGGLKRVERPQEKSNVHPMIAMMAKQRNSQDSRF